MHACRTTKEGISISHKGKAISTITGKDYNKLPRVIAMDNAFELQLFLAKITGQFKHGNEKKE